MATIIKIEPPKNLLVKHKDCGATIQYELNEVVKLYSRDFSGGGDWYYQARCPNCSNIHDWLAE